MFVDLENFDFTLQENSPCIDAGDPSDTDTDGSIRDIGASEFESETILGDCNVDGSPASIQGEFSSRVKSKFSKSTNKGFCSITPSPSGSHGVQILPQPGQFSPQGASPLPHALQ